MIKFITATQIITTPNLLMILAFFNNGRSWPILAKQNHVADPALFDNGHPRAGRVHMHVVKTAKGRSS